MRAARKADRAGQQEKSGGVRRHCGGTISGVFDASVRSYRQDAAVSSYAIL